MREDLAEAAEPLGQRIRAGRRNGGRLRRAARGRRRRGNGRNLRRPRRRRSGRLRRRRRGLNLHGPRLRLFESGVPCGALRLQRFRRVSRGVAFANRHRELFAQPLGLQPESGVLLPQIFALGGERFHRIAGRGHRRQVRLGGDQPRTAENVEAPLESVKHFAERAVFGFEK